jgi:hypothetical protein
VATGKGGATGMQQVVLVRCANTGAAASAPLTELLPTMCTLNSCMSSGGRRFLMMGSTSSSRCSTACGGKGRGEGVRG